MGSQTSKYQSSASRIQFEKVQDNKRAVDNLKDHAVDAPNSSYATRVTQKPKLLQQVKQTYSSVKGQLSKQRVILESSRISGTQLPIYELKNKPGMFYEGQWKSGKQHGKGSVIGSNGTYFQGQFENGKATGPGLYIYPDGSYYNGELVDGNFQGQGVFKYKLNQMTYEGQWKNNKPDGKGTETYPQIGVYKGQFVNGLKQGKGQMSWKDGRNYEGDFKAGYMDGEGTLKKHKGYYKGRFVKNQKQSGQMKTQTGIYNGPFKNGEMSGKGTFKFYDDKIYTGQFQHNKMHGEGQMRLTKGQVVKGIWQNGQNIEIKSIS